MRPALITMRRCIGVLLLVSAVIILQSGSSPAARSSQAQEKGSVHFIPLAGFPPATVSRLVTYYRERYGLAIETLPKIPLDSDVIDYDRQQLIADELIALMKRHHPNLTNDANAVLIGLTEGDMYVRGFNWRFAFGFHTEGRFGVISSARMDPMEFPRAEPLYVILGKILLRRIGVRFDETPDPDLFYTRVRKMTTRYIGFLHYRFPPGNSRHSVLYRSIGGLDDLDDIGEDF